MFLYFPNFHNSCRGWQFLTRPIYHVRISILFLEQHIMITTFWLFSSIYWLFRCIGVSSHFNSLSHIMAAGDAHVFSGLLTPVLTQFSMKSHRLLFSQAAEVRGENTPERQFAPTEYRTRNLQVMSQTEPPGRGSSKYLDGIIILPYRLRV